MTVRGFRVIFSRWYICINAGVTGGETLPSMMRGKYAKNLQKTGTGFIQGGSLPVILWIPIPVVEAYGEPILL